MPTWSRSAGDSMQSSECCQPTSQRGLVTLLEPVTPCSPPRRMALRLKSHTCGLSGTANGASTPTRQHSARCTRTWSTYALSQYKLSRLLTLAFQLRSTSRLGDLTARQVRGRQVASVSTGQPLHSGLPAHQLASGSAASIGAHRQPWLTILVDDGRRRQVEVQQAASSIQCLVSSKQQGRWLGLAWHTGVAAAHQNSRCGCFAQAAWGTCRPPSQWA